jgi:D-glycero-D-manno-heptose 1,7-bisphosphate phosphatase
MALIILDRDGVINHDSDAYIKTPDEFTFIDGSADAISRLCAHDYNIAIATNQSGVGRGLFSLHVLEQIHAKMRDGIESTGGRIDMIAFCPHTPADNCDCRKPRTGLLQSINQEIPLNPDTDWMVGDTSKDILAGQRMGIRAALVETGKGARTLENGAVSRETTPVFQNLASFSNWLLT